MGNQGNQGNRPVQADQRGYPGYPSYPFRRHMEWFGIDPDIFFPKPTSVPVEPLAIAFGLRCRNVKKRPVIQLSGALQLGCQIPKVFNAQFFAAVGSLPGIARVA